MKKTFLTLLTFFLALSALGTSVAMAQTCPAGQSPTASLGPNNSIIYTCAPTISNTTNTQVTIPNGQGQNLGYTPLEPIPGVTTGAGGAAMDFPTLLGNIYKIAITIGALFSVAMLTISGIRYMLSDVVTDKERARKRITACLYGLVLIAISWLILNTINPQLTTFTLNPGSGTVAAPIPSSGGASNPITSNGNALGLTTQDQKNIQDNMNNPDPTTCADARIAIQPSALRDFKNIFSSEGSQQDAIVRAYVDACAAKGL